ncbi:hypothetical protein QQP08_018149 [Theobroma cacao]|uniref:Uncharacterized protein n=1 Tax=Theobroma cacao TaxID=3641 RepID=A0A061EXB5_THECC|nr:Uncharacterized protein TCM_024411 [Theobroma cacao]WRX25662.1 hypothetical protein QQP08_018149 [Theobroma cacao]
MGCSQSKDQVLHGSHVATKSRGKSTVKDDKKIAMKTEMCHAEMVKQVTNERQGHGLDLRKEKLEAIEEEHESEDEPFLFSR